MPPEADQGNGSQGQEPGAGTQGQGQEPASQQDQQQGQGQEPGQNGPADISKMSPEELATYAARLQKDAQEARQEAANYRTQFQSAQSKITETERAQMTELERVQADLEAARGETATERQQREALAAQVEDLTRGAAVRTALAQAQALNPGTAFKVGTWDSVKVQEDGTVEPQSFAAALQALKASDPYLFRRTASADAGAGGGGGSAPEGGSSINDFVRGRTGR